tara:strand:+ start:1918 stop:2043 length:126 start_codon:yes stop_codon:yes gene_type:complete
LKFGIVEIFIKISFKINVEKKETLETFIGYLVSFFIFAKNT